MRAEDRWLLREIARGVMFLLAKRSDEDCKEQFYNVRAALNYTEKKLLVAKPEGFKIT